MEMKRVEMVINIEAEEIFKQLSQEYDIQVVFCNRDYEPQAIERDTEIYNFFKTQNIPFKAFKDQVIFDKNEIVKNNGTPYTVYTPYAKKWKEILTEKDFINHYKTVDEGIENRINKYIRIK